MLTNSLRLFLVIIIGTDGQGPILVAKPFGTLRQSVREEEDEACTTLQQDRWQKSIEISI
jgi:hypothetical protein